MQSKLLELIRREVWLQIFTSNLELRVYPTLQREELVWRAELVEFTTWNFLLQASEYCTLLLLSVCGPVLVELLQFVGISLPPHFYFYADARFFPFPTSNAPRCVTDRQAKVAMFREHRLLHRIQVQECSKHKWGDHILWINVCSFQIYRYAGKGEG